MEKATLFSFFKKCSSLEKLFMDDGNNKKINKEIDNLPNNNITTININSNDIKSNNIKSTYNKKNKKYNSLSSLTKKNNKINNSNNKNKKRKNNFNIDDVSKKKKQKHISDNEICIKKNGYVISKDLESFIDLSDDENIEYTDYFYNIRNENKNSLKDDEYFPNELSNENSCTDESINEYSEISNDISYDSFELCEIICKKNNKYKDNESDATIDSILQNDGDINPNNIITGKRLRKPVDRSFELNYLKNILEDDEIISSSLSDIDEQYELGIQLDKDKICYIKNNKDYGLCDDDDEEEDEENNNDDDADRIDIDDDISTIDDNNESISFSMDENHEIIDNDENQEENIYKSNINNNNYTNLNKNNDINDKFNNNNDNKQYNDNLEINKNNNKDTKDNIIISDEDTYDESLEHDKDIFDK